MSMKKHLISEIIKELKITVKNYFPLSVLQQWKKKIASVGYDKEKCAILSTVDERVKWYKLFGGKVDNIKKTFSKTYDRAISGKLF